MGVRLMRRKLPGGSIGLYLDIRTPGYRKKESLGLVLTSDRLQNRETLKHAGEIRAQRELVLLQQRHGPLLSVQRKENFIDYIEKLELSKPSANTRQSWKDARRHLIAFAGDPLPFERLTPGFFEQFASYLQTKVSRNSAQIYFSRIKTAIHQAIRDGMLAINPAAHLSIKKEEKLPVYLTLAEIQKLANTPAPNEDVKSAFLFSCFSGLRFSDLAALEWSQIRDGIIELTQKKTGTPMKNPLSEQAKRILDNQKQIRHSSRVIREEGENRVFVLPRQSTVDKELKKWGKEAGIDRPLSMHKARHSFATLSLQAGIDIYTTSKLLGHKNLQTTQIYAKVVDESKKKAVDKLPVIEISNQQPTEIRRRPSPGIDNVGNSK